MIQFDKYEKLGAYHWDWYEDTNFAWYKECVDSILKFCKSTSVLDLGCGEALIGSKLFERVGYDEMQLDYTGIDIDETALQLADPELDVRQDDLDGDSHFMPPGWEYLVCLNTIEHLKTPRMIINLLRQPNIIIKGAIIITDKPTGNPGRYHEHEYTKKELLDTFKEFKPKYFEINSTEFGKPITFHGVEILK